ncbi:ATP-binding cassette domain-containing protein [Dyadobacter sp. CY323]|uniref:ABC transporter ATP-binding protein n=1 Tax=Dyadobacter sp. CY323 TaxID=2907302 RepID=UPI001F2DBCD9|nr:ATP-binding cassette domain-containing protein [Dyadobacter sp. CY323]MCE6991423.1 ATP-binding cassette domain-containing protein [Dyadobacter sp. CY323]
MISFKQVCFGYEKQKALFENLNLHLSPGRIYGLLGKNGEGKSSLLRNMAGLLFPDKGEISIAGFNPSGREAEFLQDVFFIPEEPYLPSFTVEKFSERFGLLYPKYDRTEFHKGISHFNVSVSDRLDKMSYGQRKKVLIAFALACNTKVILMDEPTNGLDIPVKTQFRKSVLSAIDDEKIIVIATHQVRDLDNLIDSVIILNENKIAIQTDLETVAQHLSFETYADIGDGSDSILYAKPGPGGCKVVTRNIFGTDSRIDLEQFFNAVVLSPTKIQHIFDQNPPSQESTTVL